MTHENLFQKVFCEVKIPDELALAVVSLSGRGRVRGVFVGLNDTEAGHILAVDEAEGVVLGIDDDEVIDGGLFKDGEGIDGEGAGGD